MVFTPNAWLPSLKDSTWVVKICSHSLALACLTTLSCRTKLSAPPDIRPDASRLRMLFIMSSCADGDRSETSPPQTLQQRRAWLMTFHCFSKSTVLFDSPSRKKASWDWRVTQTATVLVVRSLARRFCFSCGGHGVTTEWNIYTKTSFKRSQGLPVNTSRAQTFQFHKFWFLRRCQCSSTCRSRGQAIGTRRSFHGKRTPFWLSLRLRCAGSSSHLKGAKFHKDSPSGKKVKLNLARAIELSETAVFFCVQLCIETLCKRAPSVAHLTIFSFEFVYEIFTEDASQRLLCHDAKKSKMTKTHKSRGGGGGS